MAPRLRRSTAPTPAKTRTRLLIALLAVVLGLRMASYGLGCQGVPMDAVPRRLTNPWMVGLAVLWSLVLVVAIVFAVLGGNADSLGYDQPGLPPSDVLAGIYYASSGVTAAVALILIGVHIGVAALRWYLDPSSRALERELVSENPRPQRQDF
jgi:hypothetical protein